MKPACLALVDRLEKGSPLFHSWAAVAATPAPTATAGRGFEAAASRDTVAAEAACLYLFGWFGLFFLVPF